jgi:hypothetical protein
MESAVKGQTYFVTEYGAKIQGRQFYSLYRAKYLGKQIGCSTYVILTNINWIGEKRINKGKIFFYIIEQPIMHLFAAGSVVEFGIVGFACFVSTKGVSS